MYDLSFGMYFFYTENAAIGLVVLQTAEMLIIIMFRNIFPMRDN